MVGQKTLHQTVQSLLDKGIFPLASIFIGPKGSGRKTFVHEHFGGIVCLSNKVEQVREFIKMSYTKSQQTFVFPDVDTMSTAASNALLKVIEECPNGNRYILTAQSTSSTLPTILSRCSEFFMDPYTPDEIIEYALHYTDAKAVDGDIIRDVCTTPGEVQTLLASGSVEDFDNYVKLVYDNIATVSGANAFKIASRVALKDGETGYDLSLFWKFFLRLCSKQLSQNSKMASRMIVSTNFYLGQLPNKSINRIMLMDMWILEIRSIYFMFEEE